MPRTDLRRAALFVWGGWLLITWLVFSLMQGIFHDYYTVALAPAVAAVVGMGVAEAWEQRHRFTAAVTLAAAVAIAAVWSFILLSRTTEYGAWLRMGVLVVGLGAALCLLVVNQVPAGTIGRVVPKLVVSAALVASLAGPAAYSVATVMDAHQGSITTAGPATGSRDAGGAWGGQASGRPGGQQGNGGVAGQGGQQPQSGGNAGPAAGDGGAGIQLATELPVMPIGGFNGSDPSPTLAQFQEYVAQGEIHYFLVGSTQRGGQGGRGGADAGGSEISTWVTQNFDAVTLGTQTYYDLTAPVGETETTGSDA